MSLFEPADKDYNKRKFIEEDIIILVGDLTKIETGCLATQTFWTQELAGRTRSHGIQFGFRPRVLRRFRVPEILGKKEY